MQDYISYAVVLFVLLRIVYWNRLALSLTFPQFAAIIFPGVKSEIDNLKKILVTNNNFYRELSEKGRLKFINKCFSFMKSKRFIGMQGLSITDEMIATISGTAAQLTYGLDKSTLSFYHTIKIFPESFYSGLHERNLKGGASIGGVLFFSWKDFKDGYADDNDKYNLGLHEMAHALRLELQYGNDFDKRFANYTDNWLEIAVPEFERINQGSTSFLRDYAGTNVEEFFAVCIEHFFEVPGEFRKALPDIYNHLCFLLNIDPCNTKNNFRLDSDFANSININRDRVPIPARIKKNYKYDAWHWTSNLVVAGLFVAVPIILVVVPRTVVHVSTIVLLMAAIVIIVASFRNRFTRFGIYLYHHLILVAVTGVALPVVAMLLVANSYFHLDPEIKEIPVMESSVSRISSSQVTIEFQLYDNAYQNYRRIRTIHVPIEKDYLAKGSALILVTTQGILGYENISSRKLVYHGDTLEIPIAKY